MNEIPPEVRRLIRERVGTMDQVEVLMRLHAAPETALSQYEIEQSSRLGPETVRRSLEHLVRSGLASHDAAANSWRFAPGTVEERRAVDALSIMYHQRPVSLVKLIYEQPPTPLKLFSDAFRFRKEEEQ